MRRGRAVRFNGRAPLALACILLLGTACSRTDNDPGPGGVTVGEAKALDDAAAMLEERDRLDAAAETDQNPAP
jgi:hypothetical protein